MVPQESWVAAWGVQPKGYEWNLLDMTLGYSGILWDSTISWDIMPTTMVTYMGVSENSVPLNPMVNDYYPY
jgi:hypothetical protein